MWENFKKKVTNFIYEEIEEELIEEVEQDEQEAENKKHNPSRQIDKQDVRTRMTFEYPKKDAESFKFPVIPDDADKLKKQITERPAQVERPTGPSQPAYMRRRSRSSKKMNRSREGYAPSVYEQKRKEQELENIPAFERRQTRRGQDQDNEPFSEAEEKLKEKDEASTKHDKIDWTRMEYSSPDELDAVFKRKNKVPDEPVEGILEEKRESTFPSKEAEHPISEEALNTFNDKVSTSQADEESQELKDELVIEDIEYGEAANYIKEKDSHQSISEFSTSNQSQPLTEQTASQETASFIKGNQSSEVIDVPHYLLDDVAVEQTDNQEWLRNQKELLQQTLKHFNIDAEIVAATVGPTVTRLEIKPALGVKVSRIRNLADDIKLNLAARDIRIEAPIPGKHTIGIEIPNENPELVHFQEMIESESFKEAKSPLTVALGLTIEGQPYFTDINKMPHGLIAGATGSGKSVCINTMILSLLYKSHYNDVKLMMIDPKMVELTQYNGIPHLLTPVITDAKAATIALKWAVDEMERRYELFVEHQVRNIKRYNRKDVAEKLPYIVIIIDELADLMLVSPQEVEDNISRIAQKARAAGIHLILATQRPSVDVITGLIKANIPSRIAFAVSSQVDSRTILDANGAEKLLGKGDMLFIENGVNKQLRLQGPFVSDDEIDRVVQYLRSIAEPEYFFEHEELFLQIEDEDEDELFEEVVQFVLNEQRASTSLLQRRFRIGYNRAARLIDTMHEHGIISAQNGSRPREVLITKSQWEQNLYNDMNR